MNTVTTAQMNGGMPQGLTPVCRRKLSVFRYTMNPRTNPRIRYQPLRMKITPRTSTGQAYGADRPTHPSGYTEA